MGFVMNRYKWLIAPLFTMALFGLTGCASLIASGISRSIWETDGYSELIATDDIIAMGSAASHTRQSASKEGAAVVLVGTKNTYVMTEGGLELTSIVNQLDGQFISVNQNQAIEFRLLDTLDDGASQFSGDIDLSYHKTTESISPKEIKALSHLGFKLIENCGDKKKPSPDSNGPVSCYMKPLHIKATLYPPAKNLATIKTQFKRTREISLVKYHEGRDGTGINPISIILMPAAIVIDVITSPLQYWYFSKHPII